MERSQWKSNIGFLAAAIGSAIGLGNIWRFSYMCYSNGGGAFLVPYFFALLTAGIPLLILEFGLGHRKRGSAPKAFHLVAPHWEWLGWYSVVFVMFGIMFYYSVIIGWCVNYFIFSFDLKWGSDPETFFFQDFLQLSNGPLEPGGIRWPILFSTAFVWFLTWFICYRDITRGIERACKIFIPLLIVLTGVLVVWSLSLPGAGQGIKMYLKPDWGKLFSGENWYQVWIDAFGQIFFTLSIGFGIMIAYASYLDRKANIVEMAVWTSVINCGYSFIAGFAVFGTLGYMAAQTGLPPDEVVKQGPGLAFVAYPKAISLLPYGREVFGMLFFFVLILAGLSSGISIVEAFACAAQDKFNARRGKLITILCLIGFAGSCLFMMRSGLFWLDIVDHFLNIYGLVFVGLLECIIIGWAYKTRILRKHVDDLSRRRWSPLWANSIKFIVPAVLIVILGLRLLEDIRKPYGDYPRTAVIFLGFLYIVLALVAGIVFTFFPWKGEMKRPEPIDEG